MRLPRTPRIPRVSRSTVESVIVGSGFFGGISLAAIAVGLIYFPAGLFIGGVALTGLSALYARSTP